MRKGYTIIIIILILFTVLGNIQKILAADEIDTEIIKEYFDPSIILKGIREEMKYIDKYFNRHGGDQEQDEDEILGSSYLYFEKANYLLSINPLSVYESLEVFEQFNPNYGPYYFRWGYAYNYNWLKGSVIGKTLIESTYLFVTKGLENAKNKFGSEGLDLREEEQKMVEIRNKINSGHWEESLEYLLYVFKELAGDIKNIESETKDISAPDLKEIQKAIDVYSKFRKALMKKKVKKALSYFDPLSQQKYSMIFNAVGADKLAIQARDEMIGLMFTDYDKSIERMEFITTRGDRGVFIYFRKINNKWVIEQM